MKKKYLKQILLNQDNIERKQDWIIADILGNVNKTTNPSSPPPPPPKP
tara:strand:- start:715 stop:858 length:144 start_codon:yes stop_codon:yes gene_type:complete